MQFEEIMIVISVLLVIVIYGSMQKLALKPLIFYMNSSQLNNYSSARVLNRGFYEAGLSRSIHHLLASCVPDQSSNIAATLIYLHACL